MSTGRPSKLTKELIDKARELILAGNFRVVVLQSLGISKATYARWMKQGNEFPEGLYGQFRDMVLTAEKEAEANAVLGIYRAGQIDPDHHKWWLERKFPQRWGRQFRFELEAIKKRLRELEREGDDSEAGEEAERSVSSGGEETPPEERSSDGPAPG